MDDPLDHTRDSVIRDPVHRESEHCISVDISFVDSTLLVKLPAYLRKFVDTPQFQRLRDIKQLGTSYYVWTGAAHNRLEHSLGVSHLAANLARSLMRDSSLRITERDVRCVQIAGLCHDLGHGPWSHVWDGLFIPKALPDSDWTHEQGSEMMFDAMVKENEIDISSEDVAFIKDLIAGVPTHSIHNEPPEKRFLFEIVANKRNGIDVDKFEYLMRDTFNLGDGTDFHPESLIASARVIDDQICFAIKYANTVYNVFQNRFTMHKRIYSHKTAVAIQHMIVDALLLAEPHLHIAERIHNPDEFVNLSDHILTEIRKSKDPNLRPAQDLVRRVSKRELYAMVDYLWVKWDQYGTVNRYITPDAIINSARSTARTPITEFSPQDSELVHKLTPGSIIVDIGKVHYGMGKQNPMDNVRFYGKHSRNKCELAGSQDISQILPAEFGEVLVRVWARDKQFFGVIQAGFRSVLASIPETGITIEDASLGVATPPTTATAPNTPRVGPQKLSDGNIDAITPMPGLRRSPFPMNSFTEVPRDFVPGSPSRRAKKRLAEETEDVESGGTRKSARLNPS